LVSVEMKTNLAGSREFLLNVFFCQAERP